MRALVFAVLVALLPGNVLAQSTCRSVEIRFRPVANLQVAVWIEDAEGNYVDTAYVSRLTGSLGLGNRPGDHRFKSDFRFPYGRRDMVLPVWAHRRNHHYGLVVMGGRPGNSMPSCAAYARAHPQSDASADECDDSSIGYHFSVSSPEGFYCSPTGGVIQHLGAVDVMSCASAFYGSKGAVADAPAFSLYPSRSDLTSFVDEHDSADAHGFAASNDVGAVSGATPPGGELLRAPIHWRPPRDGAYVAFVEVSLEGDFNLAHNHPPLEDRYPELAGYGHNFLGQPSVVYAVPFTVGSADELGTTNRYQGYGDWDGATGSLHPPDPTISDIPGSGAGRLLDIDGPGGGYRLEVRVKPVCGSGGPCRAPGPPAEVIARSQSTSVTLSFHSASSGEPSYRFDVRYRQGRSITEDDFVSATPPSAPPPPPGMPGKQVSMDLSGLRADTTYVVAVRALSECEIASPLVAAELTTGTQQFTVLHGCFIATAAYGTPLAAELDGLRRWRDRCLLTNPLGQLAVAVYATLSPPLAGLIALDPRLRAGVRGALRPLVALTRRW